jgi:putative component of membrane protein insertase Oxa1/YidC/SpoIIIJ protein YidD
MQLPTTIRKTEALGLMTDQKPSEWEQEVAEAYVNDRPLHRPDTRLRHAIIFASAYLAVTILLTGLAVLALQRSTLAPAISSPSGFAATHPVLAMAAVYGLVSILALGVCGRFIVIGSVHLYQHYAPEHIRRRCLFRPTCSEYAILAVLRYGVVLGGLKTLVRLYRRCKGTIYCIDYP